MGVPEMKGAWPTGVNRWTDIITETAGHYGLPPNWVAGIVKLESGGDQKACSPCSACPRVKPCAPCCAFGLMQLQRATALSQAKAIGLDTGLFSGFDIWDPATNIELGTAYLRSKVDRYHDFVAAAVAYNAGKVYCGPDCIDDVFWGICVEKGGSYPLTAIRAANTALDHGFPLSGPLPNMSSLPPVVLRKAPPVDILDPWTALLVTGAAAYGGYWLTKKAIRPRRRSPRA